LSSTFVDSEFINGNSESVITVAWINYLLFQLCKTVSVSPWKGSGRLVEYQTPLTPPLTRQSMTPQAIKEDTQHIDVLVTEGWTWPWTLLHRLSVNVKCVLQLCKPRV